MVFEKQGVALLPHWHNLPHSPLVVVVVVVVAVVVAAAAVLVAVFCSSRSTS